MTVPYIPHTPADEAAMLQRIGVGTIDDLFADLPADLRDKALTIPERQGQSELELRRDFAELAALDKPAGQMASFMGAGAYDHYIPAVVTQLSSRSEFVTSYTPYQPEISQGTLQSIFEFQTYMTLLTGEDVSNASLYDGAEAAAEAVLMAVNQTRRSHIVVADNLHPRYRSTIEAYTRAQGIDITGLPADPSSGRVLPDSAAALIDRQTACLVVATPSFSGVIETELEALAEAAHDSGALLLVVFNPMAAGLLTPPGLQGADIVCGEGQPLGQPLNFGGPYLGYITCRNKFMRKMPGRLVGLTRDSEGRPSYVLTIQAREQHIRREKATSNICTNQGLNALQAGIYLSYMGESGLSAVAERCYDNAHYFHDELLRSGAWTRIYEGDFFHEFRLRYSGDTKQLNDRLLENRIIGGLRLERLLPGTSGEMLLAVTEKRTKQEMDEFVRIASQVVGEVEHV